MSVRRIAVSLLSLSAAALVGVAVEEGWAPTATVPTKNDRCTNGFGGTVNEDGSRVKCGESIDPVRALKRTHAHLQKDESGIKSCVTAPLTQGEYDILVDFSYQYGSQKTCTSSMVRLVNQGRYAEACEAYTLYKFSGGFDCSTPGNKVCSGVWARNLKRRDKCRGEQ